MVSKEAYNFNVVIMSTNLMYQQDFDDIYVVMGMMETDLHKVESG
jgi:hypothetical protein